MPPEGSFVRDGAVLRRHRRDGRAGPAQECGVGVESVRAGHRASVRGVSASLRHPSCLRTKVLLFDGTGLCIYMKKLSRGQFAKLRAQGGELRMTMSELALYLEGSELVGRDTLSPQALRFRDLARFDLRELAADERSCTTCGREIVEWTGQHEEVEEVHVSDASSC